jgi:hypothetical protein
LLIPLLHASTTGLIAGTLWLRRGPTSRARPRAWVPTLGGAVLVAALANVSLGVVAVLLSDALVQVIAAGLVVACLLLVVRLALHAMLLAEAVEVAIGPDGPCSHCHRMVPRMAFCPHCGIATRATPKVAAGRVGRVVR